MVERRHRNSTVPFARLQSAKNWHLRLRRYVRDHIANQRRKEDSASGLHRFANRPSRKETVALARDSGPRKMCGCGSEK